MARRRVDYARPESDVETIVEKMEPVADRARRILALSREMSPKESQLAETSAALRNLEQADQEIGQKLVILDGTIKEGGFSNEAIGALRQTLENERATLNKQIHAAASLEQEIRDSMLEGTVEILSLAGKKDEARSALQDALQHAHFMFGNEASKADADIKDVEAERIDVLKRLADREKAAAEKVRFVEGIVSSYQGGGIDQDEKSKLNDLCTARKGDISKIISQLENPNEMPGNNIEIQGTDLGFLASDILDGTAKQRMKEETATVRGVFDRIKNTKPRIAAFFGMESAKRWEESLNQAKRNLDTIQRGEEALADHTSNLLKRRKELVDKRIRSEHELLAAEEAIQAISAVIEEERVLDAKDDRLASLKNHLTEYETRLDSRDNELTHMAKILGVKLEQPYPYIVEGE